MGFEDEYDSFLNGHLQARKGERLRRLEEGHGQAEMLFLKQVWWPQFHNFHYLHPEYEVNDFKDGKRYLDFAYIRAAMRICFEIDGYGPHVKNMSRWQFSDSLDRQNQLIMDGWTVIRFSYDQVKEQPRRCQQITQQVIGKMLGEELDHLSLTFIEKEVIRFALKSGNVVTPRVVAQLLKLSDKTVKKILLELVKKRMLVPTSGKQRFHSYLLGDEVKSPFF